MEVTEVESPETLRNPASQGVGSHEYHQDGSPPVRHRGGRGRLPGRQRSEGGLSLRRRIWGKSLRWLPWRVRWLPWRVRWLPWRIRWLPWRVYLQSTGG